MSKPEMKVGSKSKKPSPKSGQKDNRPKQNEVVRSKTQPRHKGNWPFSQTQEAGTPHQNKKSATTTPG
jgi:hypothetical protein